MGTRLTINKLKKDFFYGTKLYGYYDDWKELPSFKYLYYYLPDCDIDDVDEIPPILMLVRDFRVWITLYNEELKYSPYNKDDNLLKNKFIKNVLKMDDFEYVLLTWS